MNSNPLPDNFNDNETNSSLSRRQFFGLAAGAGAAGAAALLLPESALAATKTATKLASKGFTKTTTPGSSSKYGKVKPAIEITYWSSHPAKSKPVEEILIKRFNEANPNIRVNLQTAGANYAEIAQKFNAAIAAKQVPDLVMLSDVWWFKYALAKAITPLNDLLAFEKVDVADFQPSLIDDYKYNNSQWALPFARSTPLFYYNKRLWSAAGLPDRGPDTWAEFETWAPKLQEKLGSSDKFPFSLVKGDSYIAWTFQNILWGQGGQYSTPDFKLTLDTSEANAAGQFVRDQVYTKKYANVTSKSETDDFLAELNGCIVSSTGGLSGVLSGAKGKFDVGTAFLPKGPKGFGCPTGGAGLAIPEGIPDENKVAAMKFLSFLTSTDSTAFYSASVGYMPVRKSAVEGPVMTQVYKDRPQFRTAVDQLAKTRSQDSARVFIPGGDAILGKALESMVLNNGDPNAAWATAATALQQIIDTEVKPRLA
jgi:sn-glycerol 3-phosphate transport system substrate-binding protein